MTVQVKAMEQYFLMFCFLPLVLTFKSGLNSNESYGAFHSGITMYYLILGGVGFELWIKQYCVNILM